MRKTLLAFFILFVTNNFAQNSIVPGYIVSITDPEAKGYYFLSPIKVGINRVATLPVNIIIDELGNIIYFKKFNKGPFAGNFRLQKNGLMSYHFSNKFFLMDSTFNIIDSLSCKNGIQQEPRAFYILPNGHYALLGSETIKMDLKKYPFFNHKKLPGDTAAKVKCDVIQELDNSKNVVFEWHSKDHYQFNSVDTFFVSDPKEVDWEHGNAMDVDNDGNYYLSIKYFNEITKISRKDGQILWRLGGKKNQFVFVNDPLMFKGQHGISVLPNKNILVYDNGRVGKPVHPEGGKEYKLDEIKRTAKLVWSHIPDKSLWSSGYGNVQRLPNGNTLVNFGRCDQSKLIFDVTAPDGKKIIEVLTNDSLRNYRTYFYKELPFKLKRPEVNCIRKDGQWILEAEDGFSDYIWSNGQTSKSLSVSMEGSYYVCVPVGTGGWICSVPIYFDKSINPLK